MARRETGIQEVFQTVNQAKPRQRLNIRDEQYAWGTVEKEGVLRLIEQLGLSNNDVFVDIGSGKGALCYHVFHNSPVKSVIGVEAVQKRHEEAAMLLSQSVNDNAILKVADRRLQFVHGDALLHCNLWSAATIIFMNNVTFPDGLVNQIFKMINENCKNVRIVVAAKAPTEICLNGSYQRKMTDRIKVSWGQAKFYMWEKPFIETDI